MNTPLQEAKQRYKGIATTIVLFSVVINLLIFALPIYSLQIYDRVISASSKDTLLMLSIIVLISFISFSIIYFARNMLIIYTNSLTEEKIAPLLMEHAIRKTSSGNPVFLSEHLRSINQIKSFISDSAVNFFFDVPWSITFIIVLFLLNPLLGSIALFGCVVLFLMSVIFEIFTKNPIEISFTKTLDSYKQADDAVSNAQSIVSMGMVDKIVSRWDKAHHKTLSLQDRVSTRSTLIHSMIRLFRYLLQIAIIGTGGYLVIEQDLSMGGIIAASILSSRAFQPFESSVNLWKHFTASRQAYMGLKEVFDEYSDGAEALPLPHPKGEIELDKASFSILLDKDNPDSEIPILQNISFEIKPGEVIGLMGPNGAGKTSLLRLIAGLCKTTKGDVRLDGASTHQLVLSGQTHYIGYTPQYAEIVFGAVKDNIARFDKKLNPEEVVKAAKMAGIHNAILRFPNGYDTIIGKEGFYLSAGQRQGIALARSFYNNPAVVLLDEPTTALDTNAEGALTNAITTLKKNKTTVILVTHKKSLIMQTDKLAFVDKGKLKLFGPRAQILKELGAV